MSKWQKFLHKFVGILPVIFLIVLVSALVWRYLVSRNVGSSADKVTFAQDPSADEEVVNSEECTVYIDVGGAVADPGVYCLRGGERLVNAIQMAGGFVKSAYASKYVSRYLNLALPLKEDQKIYIPYQNELSCTLIPFELAALEEKEVLGKINTGEKKEDLEEKEEESECVSINTASQQQLMTVSGIGESMSLKIVEGRPYKVLEDLKNVSGVGDATYDKFLPFICL